MTNQKEDAMAKSSSKAVAKVDEEIHTNNVIPLADVPDYLQGVRQTGLEGLDKTDFKIPRIKLLQPLNPEITAFQGKALPSEFWHTGMNVSLGTEFRFVPLVVNKRVILWNPRESGGGILAMSHDGINWSQGANKDFSVKLKNVKEMVQWSTKGNVAESKLLEWGSFNPDDDESGPAATLSYEYLMYLFDKPDLSPIVMSCYRTAIPKAKQFNTALLMLKRPIQSVLVKCSSKETGEGQQTWHIPQFETEGYVDKNTYELTSVLAEKYSNYVPAEEDRPIDEGEKATDSKEY